MELDFFECIRTRLLPVLFAVCTPLMSDTVSRCFSDITEILGFVVVSGFIVVLNVFVLIGSHCGSGLFGTVIDVLGIQ